LNTGFFDLKLKCKRLNYEVIIQCYGNDEWGLETTKLALCTQPQQLINLDIVADFPSKN
jgi:hypothetical protein